MGLKSMKNDLETRSDFGHLALKHSPRVASFDKAVQVIIEKPLRDKAVQATAVKVLKDQHIQVDKAGFSLAKETQVEPELFETGVHSQANQNEIRAARRKNLLYAEKEVQADVEDCERDFETQVDEEALGIQKKDVAAGAAKEKKDKSSEKKKKTKAKGDK